MDKPVPENKYKLAKGKYEQRYNIVFSVTAQIFNYTPMSVGIFTLGSDYQLSEKQWAEGIKKYLAEQQKDITMCNASIKIEVIDFFINTFIPRKEFPNV